MAGADYRGTTFEVVLHDAGEAKLQTIKLVIESFGLGLAAAKNLVDSAPVVLARDLSAERASALAARFQAVKAVVAAQPAGAFEADVARERARLHAARGSDPIPAGSTCSIVLVRPGENLIDTIRLVKEFTGSTLLAAKTAVENTPTRIATGVDITRAVQFRQAITRNGGEVALEG